VTLEECERGNKMNAVGRRNLKKKKKIHTPNPFS
jgi:hypothetical protein